MGRKDWICEALKKTRGVGSDTLRLQAWMIGKTRILAESRKTVATVWRDRENKRGNLVAPNCKVQHRPFESVAVLRGIKRSRHSLVTVPVTVAA